MAADRNLLFGLLALQNGLIQQTQLVAAFHAWTCDKSRLLADHFVERGDLDGDDRAAVEALVARHLKRHGDDVEQSLAAIPTGKSTRESLANLDDPDIQATLGHVATGNGCTELEDADRTASYAIGTATSDGQRFRLLRPHARGGLGEVFVALDVELHREVALKQILEKHADDPNSRDRFVAEAEITGGLEHPGVVPVYGLGTYGGGRPFYAMRFIKGDSLKEAIDRFHQSVPFSPGEGGPKQGQWPSRDLELRKLLRRFLDVCNAVDYAHSRGVIHRDLKPANIILGKHGETLVVDWGLAKAIGRADPSVGEQTIAPSLSGSSETLPGSALGTPAYMSPEQAEGDFKRLGPRSDVYSLGATLYCLLTGKPPFQGDVADVLGAVQKGSFARPRQLDQAIDRGLEAICLKAMALDPADRYSSARALDEDLERCMADEPVTAWPEPLAMRARRWGRRHRTAVTTLIAAILVALAGTGAVLGVQTRANRELRQANAALEDSNRRERQRFDLAVEAIQRYHSGVSEDFLLKQDQFKDLRDRLLRDAVDFYRKLESLLSGQPDTRSRRALGKAYEEVAELTSKVGSMPQALAIQQKALAVREALARDHTSDPVAKAEMGKSLIAIGILLQQTGQYKEALLSLERARSVLAELRESDSTKDAALADIGRAQYFSGTAHKSNGSMPEALAAYERGRDIESQLTTAHPEDLDHQRMLSWFYNDMGSMLFYAGKTEEALGAHEAARRLKQKISDDHPDVAEYQRDLAISVCNIGILLRVASRLDEAIAAHQAALKIDEGLVKAYPSLTLLQYDVANCVNELGDDLRLGGRVAAAMDLYTRAVAILEQLTKADPTVIQYQGYLLQGLKGLGASQLAAGRPADAVSTWRRALEIEKRMTFEFGETLYYLAGCHSLLGAVAGAPGSPVSAEEGQAERDRAMLTLRRAIAAGYTPVQWMRRDPDLDSLRSREDFQLLLKNLATSENPGAR
jgi:serine/threonine-protein kinase